MDTVACIRIVDDDKSLRNALSRQLHLHGYETELYASAGEFMLKKQSDAPGCMMLDIRMPGPSGLELQEVLRTSAHPLPVIILTGHGDIPSTVRALKAGAVDFLTKPIDSEDLLAAIGNAIALDRQQRLEREKRSELQNRYDSLTDRERQVLERVAEGMLNKQIAFDLGTSERTVKAHRSQVMGKMQARSLAELVKVSEHLKKA